MTRLPTLWYGPAMWRIRWSSVLLLGLGLSTSAVGLRASLAEDSNPGAVRVFRIGNEAATVEQQSRHVLIIEGVSPDRAAAVREALWRARAGR